MNNINERIAGLDLAIAKLARDKEQAYDEWNEASKVSTERLDAWAKALYAWKELVGRREYLLELAAEAGKPCDENIGRTVPVPLPTP